MTNPFDNAPFEQASLLTDVPHTAGAHTVARVTSEPLGMDVARAFRAGAIAAQRACDRIAADHRGRTDRERKGAGECSAAIRALLLSATHDLYTREQHALNELLAVIHGDGGQHTDGMGLERSARDARAKVDSWRQQHAEQAGLVRVPPELFQRMLWCVDMVGTAEEAEAARRAQETSVKEAIQWN